MNNIEVGEYVRTKQGEIAKIVDTNIFDKTIYKDGQGAKYYLEEIANHSKNIIDLIEVGDYVNGSYIDYISKDREIYTIECEEGYCKLKDLKVDTIVTKQQFQAIEYKIGG